MKKTYEKLDERTDKRILSTDLVEMTEFILKKNFLEFETKIIQQISGTAIGTKFAPPCKCLSTDRIENDFLDPEIVKPWS